MIYTLDGIQLNKTLELTAQTIGNLRIAFLSRFYFMKITNSSYTPYTLKFKKPFSTSKGNISERKGFLIKLDSENGKSGYGDCCPLPDFGSESYEQAEAKLKDLELKIKIDLNDIEKSIFKTLEPLSDFPALQAWI